MPYGVVVAAVGVAVSAAGQVMSSTAADKAAARTAANSQRQADAIAKDYKLKLKTQKLKMQQLSEGVTNQMVARDAEAEKAMATLRVSAGESGVSGNSVDRIVNDSKVIASLDKAQLAKNYVNTMRQSLLEVRQMKAQAEGGFLAAQANVLPTNNWGATGLSITGQAISTAANVISTSK